MNQSKELLLSFITTQTHMKSQFQVRTKTATSRKPYTG